MYKPWNRLNLYQQGLVLFLYLPPKGFYQAQKRLNTKLEERFFAKCFSLEKEKLKMKSIQITNQLVKIPSKIHVSLENSNLIFTGPLGKISLDLKNMIH